LKYRSFGYVGIGYGCGWVSEVSVIYMSLQACSKLTQVKVKSMALFNNKLSSYMHVTG